MTCAGVLWVPRKTTSIPASRKPWARTWSGRVWSSRPSFASTIFTAFGPGVARLPKVEPLRLRDEPPLVPRPAEAHADRPRDLAQRRVGLPRIDHGPDDVLALAGDDEEVPESSRQRPRVPPRPAPAH